MRATAASADLVADGVPAIWRDAIAGGRNRLRDGESRPPPLTCRSCARRRSDRRRQEECRREPRGPWRRRARGRVPLEDERHRRRHDPDAAGRRARGVAELRRARRRQRRAAFLSRRQPDARAARSAGGELGRNRPDGARVPAGDDGAALRRRAGRRRARRAGARRRLRDRRCMPTASRRRPRPTWGSSKSASA